MKNPLDKDQEDLLQDIEKFNETVGKSGWNLSNRIIEDKNLSGIRLLNSLWQDVDINLSDLTLSYFEGVTFVRVRLQETDLSETAFTNCNFRDCMFIESEFSEAKFLHCQFSQCKLQGSDLSESSCQNSNWDKTDATGVNWEFARLENIEFNEGKYEEVAFSGSYLNNVTFSGSQIVRSGFSDSELNQCSFVIKGDVVDFVDAKVSGLSIRGAAAINDLKLAGVKGSDILVEGLSNSEFFGMSFSEIDNFRLRNSDLSFVSCISASFSNALFQNVSFNSAQFDDARFKNAAFTDVTFIDELVFDGATFEETKFNNIKKGDNYQGSFRNTIFEEKEPF